MRKLSFLACLLMGVWTASVANAGVLSLSIDAGTTDLNALSIGDTVTIDVVLDGLMPGQGLVSLSAGQNKGVRPEWHGLKWFCLDIVGWAAC